MSRVEQVIGDQIPFKSLMAKKHISKTVIAAFLATFLTPTLAKMDRSQFLQGNYEDYNTNFDIDGSIALIHDTNPRSEWDGALDYKRDYLAAKLFNKKACVLTKMDKVIFPSLEVLHKALHKQLPRHDASSKGATYVVLPTRVKNVAQYGKPISDLCRGVPTYFAQQRAEGSAPGLNPQSCFKARIFANIFSFGIAICGEIPGL
ncbi:gastrokine-3-like [Gracilinanus agilis]|uniref:gastrokine-3-like n=1 Tax=Gracilinanus agilis TaxID=191870 RepID=UPI001CFEC87F|nr:gastrokine-3-like [Gracilinanus agilis]